MKSSRTHKQRFNNTKLICHSLRNLYELLLILRMFLTILRRKPADDFPQMINTNHSEYPTKSHYL